MQKLLDYWANSYDFQTRETYINQYSHYKTNIQGKKYNYWYKNVANNFNNRICFCN